MNLRRYLNLMSLLILVSWSCLGVIIFQLNPEITNFFGFLLFYFALFLSILGILAIIGVIIRARFSKDLVTKQVVVSFRQAVWLSLLIVFFLVLQSLNLIRWWNVTIFILFLALLEFFFLSLNRKTKEKDNNQ